MRTFAFRHFQCLLSTVVLLAPWGGAVGAESTKEDQSGVRLADGKLLSSSALIKLLKQKLDTRYQDLEVVMLACESGEFADRAKGAGGLGGNWSMTTASSKSRCSTDTEVAGNRKRTGQDGSDVLPLPLHSIYYAHGFSAQYVKKLLEGKNTVGNKALFEYARDKDHVNGDPQYSSSGAAADNMTVHGGKKSNHAIVLSTPPSDIAEAISRQLSDALAKTGYSDAEIQLLQGKKQATLAAFETALDNMRVALDKNPGEEKAYINISAHGSYDERTVAYNDHQSGLAGGGLRLSNASTRLTMFAENPALLRELKEELPNSSGGYWADDPLLSRAGPATLSFTTFRESFGGSSDVQLYLDGLFAGVVKMGSSAGADYQLEISDSLLDQLMPDLMGRGLLDVDLRFARDSDSVQLAGFADWLDPNFAPLDYGAGLGAALTSAEFDIPAPGTGSLIVIGLSALLRARASRRRG